MKAQTLGLLFSFTAIGLSHALAILPAQEHGQDPTRRNNWGKNEPHLSSEEADQSKTRDDGTRVRKAEEGKGADPKFKEAKGKDSKGYDSKMKNGKGENDKDNDGKQQGDKNKDGKGKADKVKYCDYPTKIDPPIDLPAPGMPIHKPLPRFDTPPRVLPNSDNYIDGSLVDEFEPRVILVGKYIERLARQTPPIHIDFSNDEGPVYDEQVRDHTPSMY